ncbi:MAG: hypothetical protein RJB66_1455 [Pseudomonadota bacterium]|jgi:tRNA threonylcarbamoyladenosine biosynthesis protein TsaE
MANARLKMLFTKDLKSLEDTQSLAKEILTLIKSSRNLIGLQGDMGSGKTHFVKALAQELGMSSQDANSPSYAIHQQYESTHWVLHHLDLFRLQTEEEIESSGFWDLFYEDQVIMAVEWIDRIDDSQIPQNFFYLRLDWQVLPDGTRRVQVLGSL